MPPTAEQTQKGYARLWDEAIVTKPADAARVARDIIDNKERYLDIEKRMGIPWIMAGAIHMRESSLNFNAHMHNGDPLTGYTRRVPAGRPKVGHGPPFTFEESAADAFTMPGKNFDKLKGKWTVELMLFCEEGYNGWGYLNKGNSPYIWSWTNIYHGGKYIRDGVYDAGTWDKQPGCAAMMKALGELDADAKVWLSFRAGQMPLPKEAESEATRKERNATAAGGVGAATGTGATVAPKSEDVGFNAAQTFIGGTLIIVGLAVAFVAGVLLYKKTQLIREKWLGTTSS